MPLEMADLAPRTPLRDSRSPGSADFPASALWTQQWTFCDAL